MKELGQPGPTGQSMKPDQARTTAVVPCGAVVRAVGDARRSGRGRRHGAGRVDDVAEGRARGVDLYALPLRGLDGAAGRANLVAVHAVAEVERFLCMAQARYSINNPPWLHCP